jgi:hypothetical protein
MHLQADEARNAQESRARRNGTGRWRIQRSIVPASAGYSGPLVMDESDRYGKARAGHAQPMLAHATSWHATWRHAIVEIGPVRVNRPNPSSAV